MHITVKVATVAALSVAIAVTTNVHIAISAVTTIAANSTVLIFAVTVLCTSVSNLCGIPPVYTLSDNCRGIDNNVFAQSGKRDCR